MTCGNSKHMWTSLKLSLKALDCSSSENEAKFSNQLSKRRWKEEELYKYLSLTTRVQTFEEKLNKLNNSWGFGSLKYSTIRKKWSLLGENSQLY